MRFVVFDKTMGKSSRTSGSPLIPEIARARVTSESEVRIYANRSGLHAAPRRGRPKREHHASVVYGHGDANQAEHA